MTSGGYVVHPLLRTTSLNLFSVNILFFPALCCLQLDMNFLCLKDDSQYDCDFPSEQQYSISFT